jgi:hypothetical protein
MQIRGVKLRLKSKIVLIQKYYTIIIKCYIIHGYTKTLCHLFVWLTMTGSSSGFYSSAISLCISSLVFPSLIWSLPSISSCLPSTNNKSLSVSMANFCFSLPFVSFQFPFNSVRFFIIILFICDIFNPQRLATKNQ